MATHNTLFGPSDVRSHESGLAVSIQLPWYRSLWLSCISDVIVRVDGAPVPNDKVTFVLDGKQYRPEDLSDQWDTLWFVQDRADIVVDLGGPLEPGSVHDVSVVLDVRLLYMQIAPGKYVRNRVTVDKQDVVLQ